MKGKWLSIIGNTLLTIAVIAAGVLGFFAYRIHKIATPEKSVEAVTPEKFLLAYEDIDFKSADGLALSGWFIPGERKGPVLILCHKLGGSKASLLNYAIPLQLSGYNVFLFDFRNSGESKGKTSSFGILEARDVIGAVDYLATRNDINQDRIGILGVEMGAYASVLGALERKNIRALALDSLYPDMKFYLTRELFNDSPYGEKYASFIPLFIYSVYFKVDPSQKSAAEALKKLSDRDLLFIIGMGDRKMTDITKALYQSVKETKDNEKNLLEMPRSLSSELYSEDKKSYDEKIFTFFNTYLPVERKRPVFDTSNRPPRK